MTNQIIENEFTVDKNIIRHLIMSQAGSLDKALQELIMNAIDGGSKSVEVILSACMTKVSVIDHGCGFESVKQIIANFGSFGFDHEKEEELAKHRRWGRFGLGRGQIMAFGKGVWTSNKFKMTVDLNGNTDKSVPYTIEVAPKVMHKGCRVDVELYNPMNMWEYNSLIRDLKNNLKYCDVPVSVNNEQVTLDIDDVKWTKRTSSLAFKQSSGESTNELRIYIQGIFVRSYGHSVMGVSGDLTSIGENFALNMARNDILQSTCELFPKVKELCKVYSNKKSNSLNKDDALYMLENWFSGQIKCADVEDKAILTNIKGRRSRLTALYNHAKGNITLANKDKSPVGERIHDDKLAFVFPPSLLSDLNCETLEEFVSTIKALVDNEYEGVNNWCIPKALRYFDDLNILCFDTLAEQFDGEQQLIDKSKMTKLEAIRIEATAYIQYDLVQSINVALGNDFTDSTRIPKREIRLGKSETTLAWTDGKGVIVIEKRYLSKCFSDGLNGMYKLIATLIHEYCHTDKYTDGHSHSGEFHERFHDIMGSDEIKMVSLAMGITTRMVALRKKNGIAVSQSEVGFLNEMDNLKIVISNAT